MACANLEGKANGTRLSSLLIDKGTEALRQIFDTIHPPATLAAVLNAHKKQLKYKVRIQAQWDLLYPSSGDPASQTFDITLLMVLLRNICSLTAPASGWNTMPAVSDGSKEANIIRIKLFRNEVYAHVTETAINDVEFEKLWQEISHVLVDLGIAKHEIDQLKNCPLSPEEETYVKMLSDWKLSDDNVKNILDKTGRTITKQVQSSERNICKKLEHVALMTKPEKSEEDILQQLAKHNFNGEITKSVKLFHEGTREWLFKQMNDWFNNLESRVLVLTAGPGVGKSVFTGKVCQVYKETNRLAGCHFCKFNDTNLRNPITMLQSLASQMCTSIKGFKEKLIEQLKRPHEIKTSRDAFRVYVNEPLQELEEELDNNETMLIVIDALDESESRGKSDLLDVIAEEFPNLPDWIKILVTCRPEIPVAKSLNHLNRLEIFPDDESNKSDLKIYLKSCLPRVNMHTVIPRLVNKCEGSFLYAYHIQSELKNYEDVKEDEIDSLVPKKIGSVYQKYFDRLKDNLKAVNKELNVFDFLNILVAAQGPLPLKFITEVLGLIDCSREAKPAIRKVKESISTLFDVSNDALIPFHKSLIDWLKSDGYEEHEYTVNGEEGNAILCQLCKEELKKIKKIKENIMNPFTYAMVYSLTHGFSHLHDSDLPCCDKSDYELLVDVRVVCAVYQRCLSNGELTAFKENWSEILRRRGYSTELSLQLEFKMLWHLFMYKNGFWGVFDLSSEYLSTVVNYSQGYLNDQDRRDARSLLKKRWWCEILSTDNCDDRIVFAQRFCSSPISCVTISSDKQLIATGHEDGTVSVMNHNLREVCSFFTKRKVTCCSFSPDNSYLLCGWLDTCLDMKSCQEFSFFLNCNEQFSCCSFSPSCNRLITTDGSYNIKLWDLTEKKLLASLYDNYSINLCQFSECGFFIIGREGRLPSKYENVSIWNAFTLQRVDQRRRFLSLPVIAYLPTSRYIPKCFCCDKCGVNTTAHTTGGLGSVISLYVLPQGLLIETTPVNTVRRFQCWGKAVGQVWSGLRLFFNGYVLSTIDIVHETELGRFVLNELNMRLVHKISCKNSLFVRLGIESEVLCYAYNHLFLLKIPCQQINLSRFHSVASSFSLDPSRLVCCCSDGVVRIWDVHKRIVQSFPWQVVRGCYWSKRYLWLFHFSNSLPLLSRLPIHHQFTINVKQCECRQIECEVDKVLTFSDGVLVLKCKDGSTAVVNIVDEEFGPTLMLSGSRNVHCAAVSPGGKLLLTILSTGFQIWCNINGRRLHEGSLEGKLKKVSTFPDNPNELSQCCITSDGKAGIILSLVLTYAVVDMHSGVVLQSQNIFNKIPCVGILSKVDVYAGTSFFVVQFSNEIAPMNEFGIFEVATGKKLSSCKLWTFKEELSILAFSRKHNLIGGVDKNGRVQFVRIHVPE